MPSLPLVLYETVVEYKTHYKRHYCQGNIRTHDGMRVFFPITKFEHAFYESSTKDGKKDSFSRTRAERINWIRHALEDPDAEIYQGWNKYTKCYECSRRTSLVYENFVVVIEINSRSSQDKITATFITAYVADSNTIEKIKNSPRWKKEGR
jgi:hypothetical protein